MFGVRSGGTTQRAQHLLGRSEEQRELLHDDEERLVRWLTRAFKCKEVLRWSASLEELLLALRLRWRASQQHMFGYKAKLENTVFIRPRLSHAFADLAM